MISKKYRPKYWIGQIHLWLGLTSGLFVCFLGITGCILAFENEIANITQPYRFTEVQNKPYLPPSRLKAIADAKVPGKHAHSVSYEKGKATAVVYYAEQPEYYWIVFVNPYSGKVLKVKNMDDDFFRVVIIGHYYLWLPPAIGQPILASATLMFLLLLCSGLILWWPKNRAAAKKRFSVKWSASWKRLNYDLHNVFGFYLTWILFFIAFSGLVMGFQWFSKSAYWVTSGGQTMTQFEESFSDSTLVGTYKGKQSAADVILARTLQNKRDFNGSIEIHIPDGPKASIEVALNPDPDTYWKADYLYYDQYTLKELEVKHPYGKFANTSFADKMMRANYDIHIGAVLGLTGKVMAFLASLVAASLPITGFLIWRGRHKKKK